MAYSKTPMQDTYQTKRVPMLFEYEARAWDNYDTVAQNVLFELYKGEQTGDSYFEVIKRAGSDLITNLPGNNAITGVYWSDSLDALVWVTTNQVTVLYNGALTNYAVPGISVTDQRIGFTDFLYQDGHIDIIVTDGTVLAAINPVAATVSYVNPVVNVGAHRPYPVFLDGYLFLADEKGAIWNSNLNAPLVYSPSNFLTAEAYPDKINALLRVNNYVVAMGDESIEYFYDAANLNGSPLARYDSGSKPIGSLGAPCVVGDAIYFVGKRQHESYCFYSIENFKISKLSNNSVDRRLQHLSNAGAFLAVNPITLSGHSTVVISSWLGNGVLLPENLRSMQVYDLGNGLWTTFTFSFDPAAGPVKQTAVFASASPNLPAGVTEAASGFILAFSKDVYKFSTETYDDLGVFISVGCRTRVQDFGTSRAKFLSRALFVGDYGAQVGGAILGLRLYFDDRQGQYGVYQIPLDDNKPVVYMRGMFRNVSLELIYEGNTPLRFKYLEIDYNQGDN